jgi:hypothetical protein
VRGGKDFTQRFERGQSQNKITDRAATMTKIRFIS